jgi:rubrerythrin
MGKFWSNSKAEQPPRFPAQIIYDCFQCDEAFIGNIDHCPHCGSPLHQLYPFWGTNIPKCLITTKTR